MSLLHHDEILVLSKFDFTDPENMGENQNINTLESIFYFDD
jgi:hypothetical protein